ncbi:mediator of RNA polymerase II transcription subunit 9-like [Gigantopelta aegis]|uniref:mediator of RNA polymerase II transcription subunit 9-like n=1 Tax=Gigantopelta aegis TaxID=1735272 RepID=UPI001B88D9D3|nr:mediator of RNA polymerase II transcription subunit 9-like [Gigantopelta aegis]
MSAASAAENELNILPAIYDVIRSIEKDSHDVNQKLSDLQTQLQKAKECVDKLPGIQQSKDEQIKRIQILRKQLMLKTELLQKHKNLSNFDVGDQ